MPILDLHGAQPLEGYRKAPAPAAAAPRARKRTLGEGSLGNPANTATFGAGGFAAGKINRLTLDFIARSAPIDNDLFADNRMLRARARELAVNNPHARFFLAYTVAQVLGEAGIMIKSKVVNDNGKATAATDLINKRIDEEWALWGKKGSCSADGKFSWTGMQHLALKNVAREGENLTKGVYGRQFNPTAFALQSFDNDQLDDSYIAGLPNYGAIRMGVEVDQYARPQAYHLWRMHPNDIFPGQRERQRIPASEIVHTALWERPGQTRGYTWMSAAILPLNQYGRYEEAVVVAARASAAKFLIVESAYQDNFTGEDEDLEGEDTNADGTAILSANAGEALTLDPGQTANFIDPRFPTNNHKEFQQAILRNVASGLLMLYPYLANDLEGVNFSSIRAGLVAERDQFRVIQRWFAEDYCLPIRAKWLEMALLTTLRDIELTDKQKSQLAYKPRGWDWVDPLKDADATILKLGNGLSTYAKELGEQGMDFEETLEERAQEQAFIEGLQAKYKLKNPVVLGTDLAGDQGGKGVAAGDEQEAAEVDGGGDDKGGSSGKGGGAKPAAGAKK